MQEEYLDLLIQIGIVALLQRVFNVILLAQSPVQTQVEFMD